MHDDDPIDNLLPFPRRDRGGWRPPGLTDRLLDDLLTPTLPPDDGEDGDEQPGADREAS